MWEPIEVQPNDQGLIGKRMKLPHWDDDTICSTVEGIDDETLFLKSVKLKSNKIFHAEFPIIDPSGKRHWLVELTKEVSN